MLTKQLPVATFGKYSVGLGLTGFDNTEREEDRDQSNISSGKLQQYILI